MELNNTVHIYFSTEKNAEFSKKIAETAHKKTIMQKYLLLKPLFFLPRHDNEKKRQHV